MNEAAQFLVPTGPHESLLPWGESLAQEGIAPRCLQSMSKNDELRYGPPGETAVHLCVDMQRMFAEGTEWKMPWLDRVLPNILSITSTHPEKTIFYPLHPGPEARSGRRNVAALLRALGLHDHRSARPGNDRAGS